MGTTTKNILKWSIIGGLFAVPFISFIISKSLLFPFITGKGFTFRILVEIIFAFWLILALSNREYRSKLTLISKAILIFLGIVFLADLFSKYPYKSLWSNYERMEGFVSIIHLVAYYFVLSSMFKTEIWWKQFWNVVLASSVIMSIYGFFQLAGVLVINQGGVRVDGTFGNASYLAIYFVFNLFICLLLLLRSYKNSYFDSIWKWIIVSGGVIGFIVLIMANIKDTKTGLSLIGSNALYSLSHGGLWNIFFVLIFATYIFLAFKPSRYIYILTGVLGLIILYYTATRGAILGFIGGIILAAILIVWKERENKIIRKIAAGLLGAIILFTLVFVGVRNTNFVKNSPVLSRFAGLSVSELETQGRYYVWPMAISGFKDRPILGWGQESFNYVFNQYYNPAMYQQEQWFDRTHDIFLDWLISAGILGLLAYTSMYVALLYLLWKKSDFSLAEKSLITGLMAAYIFHNIFVFDNLISYIIFFTVLAWVSSRSIVSTSAEITPKLERRFDNETINYLFTPFITILLILCVYFVNIPAIQTGKALIYGISNQSEGITKNLEYLKKAFSYNSFGRSETLEQLTNVSLQVIGGQSTDALKQDFFNLADAQFKAQIGRTPQDARYFLLAGSFYNRVGQYDAAITYLSNAVKYSPNKPTMYFELGSSYLGKKDFAKAFETFSQGYNLEKDNPDSQIIYAIGAIYDGKDDVIKAMFDKIGQDKIISDDRILQTYVNIKDYNSAITILSARLKTDPTNYNNELNLASIYATIGNKAEALRLIRDVETKNPTLKTQLDPYIKQLSQ